MSPVPHREIVSVTWDADSHLIELSYDSGRSKSVDGTKEMAARLAEKEGLVIGTVTEGMICWTRHAGDLG